MSRFTFCAIALCCVVCKVVGIDASPHHSSRIYNQSNSAKEGTKSITGRVVDESGQPIPNAGVYLRKTGPQLGIGRSIGTDEYGRFHADDLETGAYTVTAYVAGYVPAAEAVEREYYRPGDVINLRLMKGGVITGTVTTSSGEPVVDVRVSTIRVRDGEGRSIRGASQSVNARQTDDRGVYRAYGLLPGTYLILASGRGQMGGYQAAAYDSDVPTYYPSTTRDVASEVVVRAGQEINGIDIRYRGDRGHIVTGTLSGALGEGSSGFRGVTVTLVHRSSGAIESRAFVQLQAGRGFGLYGVPDGDYEVFAQMNVEAEGTSASTPRHIVVKGADVTGIELSLAPLGWVSGRAVLEKLPDAQRPPEYRGKPAASLEELVLMARLDEKAGAKDQLRLGVVTLNDTSPDENGDFKIASLAAGRYRINMRFPTDDWFVRAVTTGSAASTQKDVAGVGLAIGTGQRVNDLTVTLAEGAAALSGKVAPASAGTRLPAQLRLHLIPAEPESADDATRFAEVKVDSEGAFSLNNLAPGRYYLHLRAVAEDQLLERTPQPLAWDAASRAKLRREAQAANSVIELGRCQRVAEYVLRFAAAVGK
jgi:hypothetical protein